LIKSDSKDFTTFLLQINSIYHVFNSALEYNQHICMISEGSWDSFAAFAKFSLAITLILKYSFNIS